MILMIGMLAMSYAHAQKLNRDTLAKYSRKQEQVKVFDRIAADIHLDAAQNSKFNQISSVYADKAIRIVKDEKASRCDKMEALRQTLKEYAARIKQVLTPDQFAMLKNEHEKYHFGRRFVTMSD